MGCLQTRILAAAARCVAPGGRLIYATCSLLAEENEAQAEIFLATHPEFERLDAAALIGARCEGLNLKGPICSCGPTPTARMASSLPCSNAARPAGGPSRPRPPSASEASGASAQAVAPEPADAAPDLEVESRQAPVSDPSAGG